MADGNPVRDSVYFYAPNTAAAIFFAAAFGAAGLCHLGQCFYYKSWAVTLFLPFSCALLIAGYATRSYGTYHNDDPQVYTASLLLIYAAPPLLQLTNHLILTRLFHFVPYFAPIHPNRTLIVFSALTAAIELLTIAGVAYITDRTAPDKSLGIGDTLTKASLVLQLIVTATFLLLAGAFYHSCRGGRIRNPRVTRPLLVGTVSMLLLLGRTIYRMVEHFGVPVNRTGLDPLSLSPVVRYEWFFYVFDAAFVLLAVVVWNVAHSSRYLPENPRMYLAQNGKTILKGPGWNDSKSKTETMFNPFAMLKSDNGRQKKFWEQNGYSMSGVRRPAVRR